MTFYEMDPALREALENAEEKVLPLLAVRGDKEEWISLPSDAVTALTIRSYEDQPGCYCVNGDLTFWDKEKLLTGLNGQNRPLRILFTCGEDNPVLHRFTFYPDKKGFVRTIVGGVTRISCRLEDVPEQLKQENGKKDWLEKEVVVDGVLSDKSRPEMSLIHRIAARGNIQADELDCCTILLSQVYVKLSSAPWEELCSLAQAALGRLEGGLDKKILFSDSPYQSDAGSNHATDELPGTLFYEIQEEEAGDEYFNSVRLKWNLPERLAYQVIWEYEGTPVVFDESYKPTYPFLPDGYQAILDSSVPYEAAYQVQEDYQLLNVVYADQVQSREDVQNGMIFEADGGGSEGLTVSFYTAESTRALINLNCSAAGNLKSLTIEGRPVVMRSNQACYRKDQDEIDRYGLQVLNVTGKYFTASHFEDWVLRTLANGIGRRRRFTARSDRGVFYIRCGASCRFIRQEEAVTCRVEELYLDYGEDRGMESRVTLLEEA